METISLREDIVEVLEGPNSVIGNILEVLQSAAGSLLLLPSSHRRLLSFQYYCRTTITTDDTNSNTQQ